ncbi:hypothetical protein SAMN05892883_3559 [Jatrophihabitans sp. GAS493]|uniref:hypothetical protein n=1 Tax=Jatrophihabitans sp. GAS493 TaxID=1907575 RepID=UPI000BB959E8|nr:hypothetical protein [Jatrophihabitans sp. GAS493]SOD74375.1 hypothetical protein SAMN05892883_3559 [Jatrophihabitans sp. GAS493]
MLSALLLLITFAVVSPRAVAGYTSMIHQARHTTAVNDVMNAATTLSLYELDTEQPEDLNLHVSSTSPLPDGGTLVTSPGNSLDVLAIAGTFCVAGADTDGRKVFFDSRVGHLTDEPLGPTCSASGFTPSLGR